MKKKLYKYGLLYIGVALAACADNADLNEPAGSTTPPAQVLNATVKNLPGAAIIYYDLPDDQNLKYVRASYKVDNMVRTVNASFYTDSLVVEGFPTKGEYDIELYSVSYGEVVSSPLVVKVNPDTPPYQKVRGTLVSAETFGGIRVNFDNPEKAKLGLGVIKKQAEGIWTQVYMHYTEAKGGDFYVRGLDAVTTDFGIFVRDRWGHLSDTLYVTETPLYEEQCDKSLFRKMALPTDSYECHSWNEVTKGNDMTRLWDGITDADPCFQTKTTTVMPQWFTFDMGVTAKLSRYKFYHLFMEEHAFQRGNLKTWEVWGRTDTPPADGSWDGWTKLMDCESHKPSGLPVGQHTAEDWEYLQAGEDFEFPAEAPPVRYIRFKVLETWGGMDFIHFTEFTFWGNVISNN